MKLDRPGIFKARPFGWFVRTFEGSQAVAISIEFIISAQLNDSEWEDWSGYEEHSIIGDFFIVKKDGTININMVERLIESIGWDADLQSIQSDPPGVTVQITVGEEKYQGRTRLKVQWLNPADYSPRPQAAPPDQIQQLQSRFGSLLRAAAGGAAKGNGGSAARAPAKPAAKVAAASTSEPPHPAEASSGAPGEDNDLPF